MSRYRFTNLAAAGLAAGVLLLTGGWVRGALLAAVIGVYGVVVGLGVARIGMQFFGPAVCRGKPAGDGRKRVALTFDDGPDAAATPKLLELLKREGIEAAFFCIGRNVAAHPGIAAQIGAEGHVLGNHLYEHRLWSNFMGGAWWREELRRGQDAITRAAGVTPVYMRPPMGLTSPIMARVVRQMGLTMVGWDVRTFDTRKTAAEVLRKVRREARDGSIIIVHDGGADPERLAGMMEAMIQDLRGRGFAFERLDRMPAQ
jgi:peptidoglycan-N-acetylglucosamine deacetylase